MTRCKAGRVASNGDGGELSLLRLLREGEGGGRREMRAHGVTGERWGVKARRGPTWPDWAGRRRRAASTRWPCPSDGRPLNQPVQFISERDFEPDSEFTRRLNYQTIAP